jgi:hypothetical protein
VLSVAPEHYDALKQLAATHATACERLGTVGGDRLVIDELVDVSLPEMRRSFDDTLSHLVHPEA